MEFLNLGPFELLLVLIVAFLILGPERVAEVGNSLGRLTRQLRRTTSDLTREALTREVERGGPVFPTSTPSPPGHSEGEENHPNQRTPE